MASWWNPFSWFKKKVAQESITQPIDSSIKSTNNDQEIANLKKEIEILKSKNDTSSGVKKESTQSATKSGHPVSGRAMILDKYTQTISEMKSYLSVTYPDFPSLSQKYKSIYSVCLSGYGTPDQRCSNPEFGKYITQLSEMNTYIHKKFTELDTNFCDFNKSILTEDDRNYCHVIFNENSTQTRQKIKADLKL